ncbi:MAG TPA: DNA polymerase III subunit epsilon [Micropepsaceae bacterium]|nr:DNA polymerase III subunit epsilon [Micropepsaceae bacterium]
MREIVLDTETTGLDPAEGHRIIEICCLELDNHLPTGKFFHVLVQPERDIPDEVVRVHGLTAEKLAQAPVFQAIADELLSFIGDAPLVAHNAEFDFKFLNAELNRLGKAPLPFGRGIDTISIAKRKFPGARYSLDELCRRFNIDLSVREKHGARIDAELLAEVYLELVGGRQARLALAPGDGLPAAVFRTARATAMRPEPLSPRLTPEEKEAHARFVAGELAGDAIWGWAA